MLSQRLVGFSQDDHIAWLTTRSLTPLPVCDSMQHAVSAQQHFTDQGRVPRTLADTVWGLRGSISLQ